MAMTSSVKDGNILGSWIDREGVGVHATSTVRLSSRNPIQLAYRGATVDHQFLLGGRYQDFNVRGNFELRKNLELSTALKYENWRFPILATGLQANVTSSVQFIYWPTHRGSN